MNASQRCTRPAPAQAVTHASETTGSPRARAVCAQRRQRTARTLQQRVRVARAWYSLQRACLATHTSHAPSSSLGSTASPADAHSAASRACRAPEGVSQVCGQWLRSLRHAPAPRRQSPRAQRRSCRPPLQARAASRGRALRSSAAVGAGCLDHKRGRTRLAP